MARKPRANRTLEGAAEFAGADTTDEAKKAIEAAAAAAASTNGGPQPELRDEAAWSRAVTEYTAQMLEMEENDKVRSEIAGRISSIRKVAKKCGVDWDLVKRFFQDHKRIRKGKKAEMVSEERNYRWLLKFMESPLGTEFTLWDVEPEGAAADGKPDMEPELAGQHAYGQGAKITDNPFHAATDVQRHNEWRHGWTQAQNAKAREMGGAGGEAATH